MYQDTLAKKPFVDTWLIFYFFLIAIGLFGMIHVFIYGQDPSYGVSREITLGLLITGYAFFVGISMGLALISSLGHIFGFKNFHVMSRKIMWLSLCALLSGFFVIFWDLEGPYKLQVLRFVEYYFPPHTTSPIWWMSTLYGLELPILIVEVYLLLKNKKSATFIAGILGFIVGISAYSNLAFVFAANVTRPFWHGPFMPIFFILSALGLGSSFALILLKIYYANEEKSVYEKYLITLSKTLFFVILTMIFFKIWRIISLLYGHQPMTYEAAKQLIGGSLAFNFWFFEILIGLIIPFFMLIQSKFKSLNASFITAFLVIIGIFFMRYDYVIAGQIISLNSVYFPKTEVLHYAPSLSEISLFISALGIFGFLYLLGKRILGLEEENHG
jgi:Ni/Fe-hydrogenase subunit HybB-like protein